MNINDFMSHSDEKPLDRLAVNGGFCGIFKTIGCIGDSLSSGELESRDESGAVGWHDFYEFSWGQYIARMTGSKVYNFSRGGMTAREYCESFGDIMDFWNKDLACQAYIIAMGVNDLSGTNEVGMTDDFNPNNFAQNKNTFAGYYARIIQKYKMIQPDAKFFLATIPNETSESEEGKRKRDEHAAFLHKLAEIIDNVYVVDLRKYAPVYDKEFKEKFFLGGHMNVAGYLLTGNMIASYVDYIIRNNMKEFKQTGFIGTPYKNVADK